MNTIRKNTIKSSKLNRDKKTQKGGKLLGEGGFGCVISPPLKCKKSFTDTPYSIDPNYISKIVEYDEDDDDVWNELNIGKRLAKVDPSQKYFSPIINGCFLHHQKNSDLQYSKTKYHGKHYNSGYNSNSKSNSNSNLGEKTQKLSKCNIYLDVHYLNLISKNAGINLEDVFHDRSKSLYYYIKENYIDIFYHYCKGLLVLKKNGILHCDIKSMNLMVNYNQEKQKASTTFIDFGLSDKIDKMDTLYDLYDLTSRGSDLYKPLEVHVIFEFLFVINKYVKDIKKEIIRKEALARSVKVFRDNRNFYMSQLNFTRFGLENINHSVKKSQKKAYGNKDDFLTVYNSIEKDYYADKLVENFLKNTNIYKWDVFSLGIIFAEILHIYEIDDKKARRLVTNMVHPFYWERYDIEQCLKDPLFASLSSKKK